MKIKKLIALLCILSLLPAIPCYAMDSKYDTVKVGLFFGTTAKDEVSLTSDGFNIGYEKDGVFTSALTVSSQSITVKKGEGSALEVIYTEADATNTYYHADDSAYLTIYPASGNITVIDKKYRGGVQFKRLSNSDMTVINVVSMDEYLYSVIGREMSPSWPIEALKCQAVCARTYAISNWNKFSSYGFNLDTTVASQSYPGMSSEGASTIQAVNETSGLVLMYGGSTAQTLYYSCNGGYTVDPVNVWGGTVPYLISKPDPNENPAEVSRYNWDITLTQSDVKGILANIGKNIGEIKNIEIVRQDVGGYVLELKFIGTAGEYTVEKTKCRDVFGSKIYSQRYTVKANVVETNNVNMYILSGYGVSSKNTSEIYTVGSSSLPNIFYVLGSGGNSAKYESSSASAIPESFTFSGHGWGHGVGMSQWGAKGMADNGYTFEQILDFYYPGTYLQ